MGQSEEFYGFAILSLSSKGQTTSKLLHPNSIRSKTAVFGAQKICGFSQVSSSDFSSIGFLRVASKILTRKKFRGEKLLLIL